MSVKIEILLICKRFPNAPDLITSFAPSRCKRSRWSNWPHLLHLINIFCTSNLSDNRKWHNSTILKQQSFNDVEISLIQLFPPAPATWLTSFAPRSSQTNGIVTTHSNGTILKLGKIFFWHYSIKIIENFLICFFCFIDFFLLNFIRLICNRKMSINMSIEKFLSRSKTFDEILFVIKLFFCQKVKAQNWSSWLLWFWLSLKSFSSWSSWSSGQTGKTGQPGQTGQTGQTDLTLKLDFPGNLCRAAFANLAMFYTLYGMDYLLNLGRERAAQQVIVCRHNRGQRRSWQERSNQSSAKDHKQGGTQDVIVDSEQRAPILKSMMKISNKLKMAAKIFNVFLKERSQVWN